MKTYTVFYAGLVYGEYASGEWKGVRATLPDGCYLRFDPYKVGCLWYVLKASSFESLSDDEVPNELRVMALLMQ